MYFLLCWQLLLVTDNIFIFPIRPGSYFFFSFIYIYIYRLLCTGSLFIYLCFFRSFFLLSLAFWLNLSLDCRGTCPPSLDVILRPYDFNLIAIIDGLRLSISR